MGWQFVIIPGWRSPPTSSQTTSEEKWRTGRWSPEGVGGGALFFEQEVYFQRLESVFGGVLFTQCGDIPLLMTGGNILNIMQESESESEKATALDGIVIIALSFCSF